jgi:hypothetical protein
VKAAWLIPHGVDRAHIFTPRAGDGAKRHHLDGGDRAVAYGARCFPVVPRRRCGINQENFMKTIYTLEKEGDGRYAVILADHSRAGLVLGGNDRWIGESADGCAMGVWMTRKEAAQAVADDASDPLWAAMYNIAHQAGMLRSDRRSDLPIDRRTL